MKIDFSELKKNIENTANGNKQIGFGITREVSRANRERVTLETIDFTNLKEKNNSYDGANGNKRCVVYNGEDYMIKFPPKPSINKEESYTNSCFSEYIGCHIYESIGVPVQKTLLGIYNVNGKEKIVVACKDFTRPGVVLKDFASQKNKIIDSPRNGYGTELSEIEETLDDLNGIDNKAVKERFWDMFIVDSLIGNWDRHNGNWGMLYDHFNDTLELAPVYDCGSSLYPQADDNIIARVLEDKNEFLFRIYEIPLSSIKINDKKINYHDFISSLQNKDCNDALKRIYPRIDMKKIDTIVEETPFISGIQKQFYKKMLNGRKELILQESYEKLLEQEKSQNKEKQIARKKSRDSSWER